VGKGARDAAHQLDDASDVRRAHAVFFSEKSTAEQSRRSTRGHGAIEAYHASIARRARTFAHPTERQ